MINFTGCSKRHDTPQAMRDESRRRTGRDDDNVTLAELVRVHELSTDYAASDDDLLELEL
jgi:hypothetical protein